MANIENILQPKAEKKILVIFFPAILGSWPLMWLLLNHYNKTCCQQQWIKLITDSTPIAIAIISTIIILLWGYGNLIHRLAMCIENHFDKRYHACDYDMGESNTYNDEIKSGISQPYDKNWYSYLQYQYKNKDIEPAMFDYYFFVVSNYMYEISTIVAIAFQLVLFIIVHWHINDGNFLITIWCSLLNFAISYVITCFLCQSAWKSIQEVHYLRKKMLEMPKWEDAPNSKSGSINIHL